MGKGKTVKKKTAKKKTAKKKVVRKKPAKSKEEGLGPLPDIDFGSISTSPKAKPVPPPPPPAPVSESIAAVPSVMPQEPAQVAKVDHTQDDEALNRLLDPLADMHDMPTQKEVEEVFAQPEKKEGFFSRLFSKKKQDPVVPDLSTQGDVPPPPVEDVVEKKEVPPPMPVEKEPETEPVMKELAIEETSKVEEPKKNDDEQRRYAQYLDNLKRRLDMESRERHQQARSIEKELDEREKKIEDREQQLLQKEFDAMQYDQLKAEIDKLKHEVEDKTITLKYKDQQLSSLEDQLSSKQDEYAELERSFAESQDEWQKKMELQAQEHKASAATQTVSYSSELDAKQGSIFSQANDVHKEVSNFGASMDDHFQQELDRLKNQLDDLETEPAVSPLDHEQYMKDRVQEHIDHGLSVVGAGDKKSAAQAYVDGRDLYKELKEHRGSDDKALYDALMGLYNKIRG